MFLLRQQLSLLYHSLLCADIGQRFVFVLMIVNKPPQHHLNISPICWGLKQQGDNGVEEEK